MLVGLADQQPAHAQAHAPGQDAGSGPGIELATAAAAAADVSVSAQSSGVIEKKMPAKGSAMVQAGAVPRGVPGHQRSPTETHRTLKAAERLAKLKARLDGPDHDAQEPVTPGSQSWDGDEQANEQRTAEAEAEAEIDASAPAMLPPPITAQPQHETEAGDDE